MRKGGARDGFRIHRGRYCKLRCGDAERAGARAGLPGRTVGRCARAGNLHCKRADGRGACQTGSAGTFIGAPGYQRAGLGFNEPLAVGTALAVDELELGDRVIEIAFDTNPICVELLQKGTVSALIVQNPYAMGYLGVEKAWQSLQGQRFDANTLTTPQRPLLREIRCLRSRARRRFSRSDKEDFR